MKSWVLGGMLVAACVACSGGSPNGATTTHPTPGDGGSSSGGSEEDGGGSSSGGTSSSSSGGEDGGPSSHDSGSKPTGKDGGSSVIGSTGVTVIVSPDTTLEPTIVNAIKAATKSVHMTMYILDDTDIINELVDQKRNGLEVEVVLNQTFPTDTTETNPATYTTLTNAGVGVVWRNGPPTAAAGAYTHEKTFILDAKQAWIMTINLDHSSFTENREYVVVDNEAADVAEAETVFSADYAGTATSGGSPLILAPDPPCNSRASLVALIASATTTCDVEVEEFSDDDTGGVTDALAAAAKKGVATRLILANATPSTNQTSAIATVKAAGTKVVVSGGTGTSSTSSNPYIHAKAITVDCSGTTCAGGYVGSENFTAGSLGYNRELGLVITNATELAKVQTAINTDFAAGTAQ